MTETVLSPKVVAADVNVLSTAGRTLWTGGANQAVDPQALLAHLADSGLSKYDMPEFFISLAQFPLTPSGKILKRHLVDMAQRGDIQPEPVRYKAPAATGA